MSAQNETPRQPAGPTGAPRSAPGGERARAEALYEQGMAYYQRREWRQALDNFRQVKAIEPGWPGLDPLIDEARWFLQLEEVDDRAGQALQEESPERRRRPGTAVRWLLLALLAGGLLAALAWWQGWLPDMGNRLEHEALYNRGQASLAVGDYQGAKEAFAALARSAPERYVALAQEGLERAARLEQIALAYEEANDAIAAEDWDTAEARLRTVMAVDPVYADAAQRLEFVLHQREVATLFRAGVAAYDTGNSGEAIEYLERLSELDSAYQRDAVRELLFVLYLRDGRALLAAPDASADAIRQAIARFGKALALRPRNVEAAEERQLANRLLDIRQALDRDELERAEAGLANLLAQRTDYADGQALTLYYDVLLRRGDAARAAGDEAAAVRAFQTAVALPVQDPSRAQAALQQMVPDATPTSTVDLAPTPFVEVQSDTLNVRLGPGTDYPIVGQLAAGAQVALIGRNEAGDWLVVCCVAEGKPGWVAARLVRTEADLPALPVGLAPTLAPTATPAPAATVAPTATPMPDVTSAPTLPPTPAPPPQPTATPTLPPR